MLHLYVRMRVSVHRPWHGVTTSPQEAQLFCQYLGDDRFGSDYPKVQNALSQTTNLTILVAWLGRYIPQYLYRFFSRGRYFILYTAYCTYQYVFFFFLRYSETPELLESVL